MHRRKDIYGEDADDFRPERWEGDALKNVGYAYLPFNGGRRPCLGRKSSSDLLLNAATPTLHTSADPIAIFLQRNSLCSRYHIQLPDLYKCILT